MSEKEVELLVNILNLDLERLGYNIDIEGFGYNPETLEISACDGSLEENLQLLFDELCEEYNNKNL